MKNNKGLTYSKQMTRNNKLDHEKKIEMKWNIIQHII